ncbi:Papain family cysteine protease [Hibiscus syriacus]|uniref:Papain family cysteine protease n=1 Tax=Hibiscus syriacus TaxID=106335 RepID=A0A6A3CKG8_HIBSY|nr:stemmadenine O-acetyltransferase-like [Hibiscus syriacus]KAE8729850.1 Papain family cysteine protease [Hibiscus syriacus]
MKPFNLTFFDQLIPQLTLQISYSTPLVIPVSLPPLSGQIKENMFIDSFDEGVSFLSAQAGCQFSEFLKYHEVKSLNKLLLCHPFSKEFRNKVPPLVCQATIFAYDGITIGLATSHKFLDGKIMFNFVSVWTTISRGSYYRDVGFHGLAEASKVFPPRNEVPKIYLSMIKNLWFMESNNYITKRFTFDAKSISELRAVAKGEL